MNRLASATVLCLSSAIILSLGLFISDPISSAATTASRGIVVIQTYPGSNEDLIISTGINANPTTFPDVKLAQPADFLTVHFESPGGSYNFDIPVLLAQLFNTGTPPVSPINYPELHVNPTSFAPYGIAVLYDGQNAPFGPGVLPPGGMTLAYSLPFFAPGTSIMLQAAVLAGNNNNPFFTATDGHEVQM